MATALDTPPRDAAANTRRSQITPRLADGSLFGENSGVNSENVAFFVGCHATRARNDHVFFMPEEHRREPLGGSQ